MVGSEMPASESGLQTVKSRVNIKDLLNQVYESKDLLLEIGMWACIGFFAGYLLKRYSGIIALLILFVAALAALNQIELITITINWHSIYEFFGVQPALATTDNLTTFVWDWTRSNIILVISAVVGFLVGLRIG